MENNPHDPKQTLDDPLVSTDVNKSHEQSLNDLFGDAKSDDVNDDNDTKNKNLREEANTEDYNEEYEEEEEEEEEDLTEALLVQMGYWKPEPKEPPPMASSNGGIKLVSVIKGSREKEGMERAKEGRSVWWAPDVYDPVPKSPEHFARGRTVVKMKIESKKGGGKNKQTPGAKGAIPSGAGGGGKGGKGKDKKQGKKYGGSANKCYDSFG